MLLELKYGGEKEWRSESLLIRMFVVGLTGVWGITQACAHSDQTARRDPKKTRILEQQI